MYYGEKVAIRRTRKGTVLAGRGFDVKRHLDKHYRGRVLTLFADGRPFTSDYTNRFRYVDWDIYGLLAFDDFSPSADGPGLYGLPKDDARVLVHPVA